MKNCINKNSHYFALLSPLHRVTFAGVPLISYTSGNDKLQWVECRVVEDRFKVDDGYKVTLEPLDDSFGRKDYYQLDFKSLMKDGYIIEKIKDSQRVEKIIWHEPLTHTIPLACEAWMVTE